MVKVIGKIDIDSLDSSTKPKTKGKHFRLKTYRKRFLRQWQEHLKQEQQIMNKPTTFNGTPHEVVMSYRIPEEIAKEHNLDFNTNIVPIVDISSLANYGIDDNEIGSYYASRSELMQRFYAQYPSFQASHDGAEPSVLVPYKEEGDAEFTFDHFALSWDKKTVYAVYKYNSTIS